MLQQSLDSHVKHETPDARSDAERADDALKHLLSVPKEVIDEREAEYKRRRTEERQGQQKPGKKKQPG